MAWQILAAAGVQALGSALGANQQSNAAKDAADAQTRAAEQQLELQRQIYEDQRMLQQPYYQGGLQAMYGNTGLMNLLGHGGGPSPAVPSHEAQPLQMGGQPQNAFANFASGSYGATSPQAAAQQESDQFQGYVQQNSDLLNAFNGLTQKDIRDIASTQYDRDGDGRISMGEFGNFHYDRHGAAEGRQLQSAAPAQAAPAPAPVPATTQVGPGQYMPTGKQPDQMAAADPVPQEGPQTQTLRQTPGYMFMQDETRRMREGSAAARGELLSGSAIAEADRQVLGLADQTYQQSVNNNFQLANLGMGAAAQTQAAGTNFAIGAGNAIGNAGNAQANGYFGRANAFNAGLQGVGDAASTAAGYFSGSGGSGSNQSFTFNQNGGNRTGWVSN